MPVRRWDAVRWAAARGMAVALLRGVGQGEDYWKDGPHALHLRRRLGDAEIAGLDPAWLALPAIDEAG
jgi:hypothetical protein